MKKVYFVLHLRVDAIDFVWPSDDDLALMSLYRMSNFAFVSDAFKSRRAAFRYADGSVFRKVISYSFETLRYSYE